MTAETPENNQQAEALDNQESEASVEATSTPKTKAFVSQYSKPGNVIAEIEKSQLRTDIPVFKAGDTVVVRVNVVEGKTTRKQAFEGVVIAKKNRGLNSSFIVRKISSGSVGVERTFITHSAVIDSIEVLRRGSVRRAKLYYLRDLSGRKARIKENVVRKVTENANLNGVHENSDHNPVAEATTTESPETRS